MRPQKKYADGREDAHPQVLRLVHPEHRRVSQQDVAYGAPSRGRDGPDDDAPFVFCTHTHRADQSRPVGSDKQTEDKRRKGSERERGRE